MGDQPEFSDGHTAGRWLPHEWVFGGFLVFTSLRMAAAGVWGWALFYALLALASVAVIAWCRQRPDGLRWRVRLLFYPAAMGMSFYALGESLPVPGTAKVDELLLGWDRALLGETPAVTWEPWLRPWLVDLMMAGYLFFFYYLVAGPGHYFFRNLSLFRANIVGLFTMYGLAFTGYVLVPAGGPHRFMVFETPLDGPWILNWTLKTVNDGSNTVDVFPSVHFAATLYLLLFDWRHHRRRFWWALPPGIVLSLATMYLRFHYFVDLLAGLVVGLVGWWVALLFERSAPQAPAAETA